MRILVVNDDGIKAEGLIRLAAMAAKLGEVCVVAPEGQCSAMSQRITVHGDIRIKKTAFPVETVEAYCISGTPADCVKTGIGVLMKEKPDYVFSGINNGYNAGYDIAYSGTVGAAMEALFHGIPAIAFSNESNGIFDVADRYLLSVTKDLLGRGIPSNRVWNVNFPGCRLMDFCGIKEECNIERSQYYRDKFLVRERQDGCLQVQNSGIPVTDACAGTDIRALMDHCISIGQISNALLK